jgi:hypothetical protein
MSISIVIQAYPDEAAVIWTGIVTQNRLTRYISKIGHK